MSPDSQEIDSAPSGQPEAEQPAEPPRRVSMWKRTLIGAGLVLAFSLLTALDANWPQGYVFAAVGAALVAIGMDEFARIARRAGAEVHRPALVLGGAALFVAQWSGWASAATPSPWLLASVILCVSVMAAFTERILTERIEGALAAVSATAAGLVYVPLLLGFLTAVRLGHGVAGVLTVVIVCKAGSTGAYFIGSWFGRRKMSPKVSPGKTWAGAVAAVVSSGLVAYALGMSSWGVLSGAAALVFGAAVGVAGILGDLAASLLKREAGIKDSGSLLPGTGGMLDLLDDVLFAAPVSYMIFSAFPG